jgi:hypothetical protein
VDVSRSARLQVQVCVWCEGGLWSCEDVNSSCIHMHQVGASWGAFGNSVGMWNWLAWVE